MSRRPWAQCATELPGSEVTRPDLFSFYLKQLNLLLHHQLKLTFGRMFQHARVPHLNLSLTKGLLWQPAASQHPQRSESVWFRIQVPPAALREPPLLLSHRNPDGGIFSSLYLWGCGGLSHRIDAREVRRGRTDGWVDTELFNFRLI